MFKSQQPIVHPAPVAMDTKAMYQERRARAKYLFERFDDYKDIPEPERVTEFVADHAKEYPGTLHAMFTLGLLFDQTEERRQDLRVKLDELCVMEQLQHPNLRRMYELEERLQSEAKPKPVDKGPGLCERVKERLLKLKTQIQQLPQTSEVKDHVEYIKTQVGQVPKFFTRRNSSASDVTAKTEAAASVDDENERRVKELIAKYQKRFEGKHPAVPAFAFAFGEFDEQDEEKDVIDAVASHFHRIYIKHANESKAAPKRFWRKLFSTTKPEVSAFSDDERNDGYSKELRIQELIAKYQARFEGMDPAVPAFAFAFGEFDEQDEEKDVIDAVAFHFHRENIKNAAKKNSRPKRPWRKFF